MRYLKRSDEMTKKWEKKQTIGTRSPQDIQIVKLLGADVKFLFNMLEEIIYEKLEILKLKKRKLRAQWIRLRANQAQLQRELVNWKIQ